MKKYAKTIIEYEEKEYKSLYSKRDWIAAKLTLDAQYQLWCYQKRMRIAGYYYNEYKNSKGIIKTIYLACNLIARRRRHSLGNKLSVFLGETTFDEGLIIYHNNIVVNGHAKIGKNCKLHGNNVIGNNGKDSATPIIGDNVDIGTGAIIIGDGKLANNIKVGAGAVVVKSCLEEGVTLVGIPASPLR